MTTMTTMTTTATDIPASPAQPGTPAPPDERAGLSRRTRTAIIVAPVAITIICLAMCVPPATRRVYEWLTSENKPVEMATFVLALAAAVMAIRLAVVLLRRAGARFAGAFYVLFALGMFFIGMEEISWGQQLFGWETPANWNQANAQGETTLHNLGPFQGHNDILRFAFGFGGLIGVALAPLLPRLRVLFPSRLLVMWFLVIAGISAAQLYCDAVPTGPLVGPLKRLGDRLAEVVELLIAIAAVLYLWLNIRFRASVTDVSGAVHPRRRSPAAPGPT
jgi:hypothetical protein